MIDFALHVRSLNGVSKLGEIVEFVLNEVTWTLNGIDSFSFTVHPLEPSARDIVIDETELWLYIDDELTCQGVPRKLKGPLSAATYEVEGILSYLEYAYVNGTDLVNENLDQFSIAQNLLNRAQTGTNADRNIESSAFSPSGVSRSITYVADEFPNIWDALVDLTELDNGFDFGLVYFPDGRREWTPYYPFRGSEKRKFALELDQRGRNRIVNLTYAEDGALVATEAFDSGATLRDDEANPPTEEKMIGHYEDSAKSVEKGRMQKVISDSQITEQAWLDAKAKKHVETFSDPLKLPELEIKDPNWIGNVFPGDIVPVRVDYGVYQIHGDFRINQQSYQGSTDTIKLVIQPS